MDCETVLTTYLNSYSASRSERKTNRKTISAHFVESSVAKERSVCAYVYVRVYTYLLKKTIHCGID